MKAWLFGLLSLLALLGCASQAQAPQPARIIALGDLHGDWDAARRALRLAGVINDQEHWIGGPTQVVQTGDLLDRGDQELELLHFLEKLAQEAEQAGGRLHLLNGNHEIMNAQGDFRYVTPHGFESFNRLKLPAAPINATQLQQFPPFARGRAVAFLPGGPYALKLAQRPAVLQLGSILFVHGGLHPAHGAYGLEQINRSYQDWLAGKQAQLPEYLQNESSPIWSRAYSQPNVPPDCEQLKQTLQQFKARFLVVGHSVQSRANSACNGQVWRIDVGLARHYGGPIQVLEIQGEKWRVLEEVRSPQAPPTDETGEGR